MLLRGLSLTWSRIVHARTDGAEHIFGFEPTINEVTRPQEGSFYRGTN